MWIASVAGGFDLLATRPRWLAALPVRPHDAWTARSLALLVVLPLPAACWAALTPWLTSASEARDAAIHAAAAAALLWTSWHAARIPRPNVRLLRLAQSDSLAGVGAGLLLVVGWMPLTLVAAAASVALALRNVRRLPDEITAEPIPFSARQDTSPQADRRSFTVEAWHERASTRPFDLRRLRPVSVFQAYFVAIVLVPMSHQHHDPIAPLGLASFLAVVQLQLLRTHAPALTGWSHLPLHRTRMFVTHAVAPFLACATGAFLVFAIERSPAEYSLTVRIVDAEGRTPAVVPSGHMTAHLSASQPVTTSPWGEFITHRSWRTWLPGVTLYDPYEVGEANSDRFVCWQFARLAQAYTGETPEIHEQKVFTSWDMMPHYRAAQSVTVQPGAPRGPWRVAAATLLIGLPLWTAWAIFTLRRRVRSDGPASRHELIAHYAPIVVWFVGTGLLVESGLFDQLRLTLLEVLPLDLVACWAITSACAVTALVVVGRAFERSGVARAIGSD